MTHHLEHNSLGWLLALSFKCVDEFLRLEKYCPEMPGHSPKESGCPPVGLMDRDGPGLISPGRREIFRARNTSRDHSHLIP